MTFAQKMQIAWEEYWQDAIAEAEKQKLDLSLMETMKTCAMASFFNGFMKSRDISVQDFKNFMDKSGLSEEK